MGEDIAGVAERLRMVRSARRKFLRMWAIDHSMIDPMVERLALDLGDSAPSQPPAEASAPDRNGCDAHPDSPPVDNV